MYDEPVAERTFTVAEARQLLDELLPRTDELVRLRADLTIARHAREEGGSSPALAETKAMEARISEIVDSFGAQGVQVKGIAPLLLDFPMRVGARDVLLCWLEGERSVDWWHDASHGFAGRRRIEDLGPPDRP